MIGPRSPHNFKGIGFCRSPRLLAATHVPPLTVKMAFSNGNLSVRAYVRFKLRQLALRTLRFFSAAVSPALSLPSVEFHSSTWRRASSFFSPYRS